ncbi:MAG: glycoside hydrolase family 78 protein [Alistipes sp.]|nr:glycoside hydrolase family 78 protein [Alistipes sp.]
MNRFRFLLYSVMLLVATTMLSNSAEAQNRRIDIVDMRCEYSVEPLFIDKSRIRFTWAYAAQGARDKGFEQLTAEVLVAENEEDLKKAYTCLLTSGRINTDKQRIDMLTVGLEPHKRYCWQVRIYNGLGGEQLRSDVQWFSTAKLLGEEWQAKWITDQKDKNHRPAPMLRKRFEVKGEVQRAMLYISAAGYYDAMINGVRVSDDWLSPGFTQYDKRNLYMTYDVTDKLQAGANAITATLGNGFYNEYTGMTVWQYESAPWRNRPRMICELHIDYTDGSSDVVVSDKSWRTTTGAVVGNVIYAGDVVDARLDVEGWCDASFDDAAYPEAVEVDAPSDLLLSQQMPPIRATEHCKPVKVDKRSDREYVFSFAENMAGVCTLRVKGERGTRITMEHGELKRQDGSVEMANIAIYAHPVGDAVFQTDIYTLKGGDGYEEFTPRFHYNGFQYVTVRADRPIELDESSLTAHFIHTDVESIGTFESSNEMWNKLWRAVRRSYLSNLYGIPTDCPQREKNGWTADAHISIDIALTNYDAILAYEKWIDDIVDNQREDGSISGVIPGTAWGFADWIGPVWDAVMFIIPDALYNYYGDESSIRRIYPTCQRYLEYLRGRENEEGVIAYGLSDWCFWQTQTPNDYTAAAFYYYDNTLMARFARILGKREDAERYAKKAKELQKYINNKFLDAETGVYSIGKITAQALPLALGFAPENLREKVAARLNEAVVESGYVCDFGLLGSKYTLRMLVDYGYVDTAYRLATQTKRPSWGNWIESGFTTPLETWAIRDTFRDSSANHVFFGDIAAWMHSHIAGIQYDRDKPGFSHIIIRPAFPEGLEWAKASYKSVRGEIASSWRRHGDKVTLQVLVPLNTTATVYFDQKYEIKGTGTPITLVGNAVKSK